MKPLNIALITLLYLITSTVIAAENKIIELNTPGTAPLNTSQLTGFIDLIAKEALSRIGITLKTVHLPAERGLMDSNAGIEDGELVRIKGLDKTYTNLLRVPEKIMDWEFVAFSKTVDNTNHGWQGIKLNSVAIVKGWKILERSVPPESELIKAKTIQQMFSLLRKNRVDIVIYEKWGGLLQLNTINNNKQSQKFRVSVVKIL